MSTFRYDFTIAEVAPSASGAYPLSTQSTTYMPETSIYFQHGDTIQAKHTHPLSPPLNINYTGPDVHEANPDPSNEGSQVSGAVRTLTWSGNFTDDSGNVTNSTADYFTQWFFFAPNNFGANAYSQKIVYRRVEITSFSGSATTISPGGTVTFTIGGLQGLAAPSGANGNCLYLSVFDSSNNLVSTNISWDSSSNQLGRVKTTDLSTVLTTSNSGTNLADGTYTVYVTHYGGESLLNGGGVGNRFYGSERRLKNTTSGAIFSANFTVQSPTQDTDPTQFNLGADQTNLTQNQEFSANLITVAGLGSGVTATAVTSGSGNPQISVGTGSPISFGAFTTNDVGVVNGNQIRFKMYASGTYGGQVTGTLTIGGTINDSLQLTTQADPGGSSGGASGTQNYGVAVLSPPDGSGNQVTTFGPNSKVTNLIDNGTATIPGRTGTALGTLTLPASGTYEGVTSTNQADIDIMVLMDLSPFIANSYQLTRGNGTFTFTNANYVNIPIDYYVIRFS
tara:strand:- start:1523 stop:3043 length:1521 start_codon:yes stop_codon:yes gene_type:complete